MPECMGFHLYPFQMDSNPLPLRINVEERDAKVHDNSKLLKVLLCT